MSKTIVYNGVKHVVPDDATDDDITALFAALETPAPTPTEPPGFFGRLKKNYQTTVDDSVDTMASGADMAMSGDGILDRAKGAGLAALGGVGYVASPLTAATKTIVADPVKSGATSLGASEPVAEFMGNLGGAAADVFSGAGLAKAAPTLARAATSTTNAVKPILRAIPKAVDSAMTLDALKAAKNAAYDTANKAGVVVKPEAFKGFVDSLEGTLRREGYDPDLHPNVAPVIKRLREAADEPTQKSLDDIEILRKVASAGREAADPKNKGQLAKSYTVLDGIDDFVDNIQPHHLLSGDSEVAATALKEARKLHNKSKKIEDIEEIVRVGEDLEDPRYVQNQFKAIVKNQKRFNRYSQDEQDLIKKIARTGNLEGLGRLLSPSSADFMGATKAAASGAVGFVAGGPLGAVALPMAATGVRMAGNAARRSNIKELEKTISRGEAAPGFMDRFRAERAKQRLGNP